MSTRSLLFALLLAHAQCLAACGDDRRTVPPTTDAGTDGAMPMLTPEDIPAVAIGGDPAAVCPEGFAAAAPVAGVNEGFSSAGQSRDFVLLLPPASFTGPRPIFFGFNGTGENGSSFTARAELEQFAAMGFVVVAPSSNMNGALWPVWDDMRNADDHDRPNADIQLFDDLLACMGAHFEVDQNRIYVGGHSAGGIFTNAILQRRSDVIAGGIVASGVFDLTSPPDLGTLDAMFVIVTWGGDDDSYSGGVGVTVPEINFVEQASFASVYYENEPNIGQTNCHINADGGHYWLPINGWFAERLLEHPKGVPGSQADLSVPPSPQSFVTCTAEPFSLDTGDGLVCPEGTPSGCQTACQLLADCAVSNATVSGIVGPQIEMFGFGSVDAPDCGGCVTKCEGDAGPGDEDVFTCLEPYVSMCAPGITGFFPATNGVDACCEGRSDSPFCVETCRILLTNDLAGMYAPNCAAL